MQVGYTVYPPKYRDEVTKVYVCVRHLNKKFQYCLLKNREGENKKLGKKNCETEICIYILFLKYLCSF